MAPDLVRSVVSLGTVCSTLSFLHQASRSLVAASFQCVVKVYTDRVLCDVMRFPILVSYLRFCQDSKRESGSDLMVFTADGRAWMVPVRVSVTRCPSKPTPMVCSSDTPDTELDLFKEECFVSTRRIRDIPGSFCVASSLNGCLVHAFSSRHHMALSSSGFAHLLYASETSWQCKSWSEPLATCCLLLSPVCEVPLARKVFAAHSTALILLAGNLEGRVTWTCVPQGDQVIERGVALQLRESVAALLFCQEGQKQALVALSTEGFVAVVQNETEYYRLLCPELSGKLIVDAAVNIGGVILILSQRALLKFDVWQQPVSGMLRAELVPIALSLVSIAVCSANPALFALSTACGKALVCNASALSVSTGLHPCLNTPSVVREGVLSQSMILDEMVDNIRSLYERELQLGQGAAQLNRQIGVLNTALHLKDTIFNLRVSALLDRASGSSRLMFRIVVQNRSDESFVFPSNSSILVQIRLQNARQSYKVFTFTMVPTCSTLLSAGATSSDPNASATMELQVSCQWEASGGLAGFFVRGKVDLIYDFQQDEPPPVLLQSNGVTAVFTSKSVRSTRQSLGHFYLDVLDLMYVDTKPGPCPRLALNLFEHDPGGWLWLREVTASLSQSAVSARSRPDAVNLELALLPSLEPQALLTYLIQGLPRNGDVPLARIKQALCSPPIGFKHAFPSPLHPRFQLRLQEAASCELASPAAFSTRVLVLSLLLPFPDLFPAVRCALLRRLPASNIAPKEELWQAVCAHLRSGGWKQLDHATNQLISRLQGLASKTPTQQAEAVLLVLKEAKKLYFGSRELNRGGQPFSAHVL